MDVEYKHTARVNRDSWFIRFYCWLWLADPTKIDFCRLFWGYFPPFLIGNLLVRVIGYLPWQLAKVVAAAFLAVADWLKSSAPTAQEMAEYEAERAKAKREKLEMYEGHSNRFFAWVSRVADRFVAVCQAAWPIAKWPVFVLAAAIVLTGAVALLYLAYLLISVLVANVGIVAIVVACGIGVIAAIVLVLTAYWATRFFLTETVPGRSLRGGVKGGTLTFTGALRTGFGGVKSRTCPKIELVD